MHEEMAILFKNVTTSTLFNNEKLDPLIVVFHRRSAPVNRTDWKSKLSLAAGFGRDRKRSNI